MITAIIGPAGSGKTTILKHISYGRNKTQCMVLEADAIVADAYSTTEVTDFLMSTPPLNKAYYGNKINKKVMLNLLMADHSLKEKFQNFLFDTYFLPTIVSCREADMDLIVDGIMPEFLPYFDQVIYVEMRESDRLSNLAKRKVSPSTADKLVKLQEGMFPSILGEERK